MYTINLTENKIVFSYTKTSIFEELKMVSALKAQQIISKDGTDLSDMFIITDDEQLYLDSWLNTVMPYITSALPQQHLETDITKDNAVVTVFSDLTRQISEGNIVSADGVLRNLLIFGCLAEWYSSVAQPDFNSEYSTKLGENIKLFSEILFDSRKRRVGTLFSASSGSGHTAPTVLQQIEILRTLIEEAIARITTAEGTLSDHTQQIDEHSAAIEQIVESIEGILRDIEEMKEVDADLLRRIEQAIVGALATLQISINGEVKGLYDPKSTDSSINIEIPKRVSDLLDGSSYLNREAIIELITQALQDYVTNQSLLTTLRDYATKQWVIDNFGGGGGGGEYVDLVSDQTVAGLKTFNTIKVSQSLGIPTAAPQNPVAGVAYLYLASDGNYSNP